MFNFFKIIHYFVSRLLGYWDLLLIYLVSSYYIYVSFQLNFMLEIEYSHVVLSRLFFVIAEIWFYITIVFDSSLEFAALYLNSTGSQIKFLIFAFIENVVSTGNDQILWNQCPIALQILRKCGLFLFLSLGFLSKEGHNFEETVAGICLMLGYFAYNLFFPLLFIFFKYFLVFALMNGVSYLMCLSEH